MIVDTWYIEKYKYYHGACYSEVITNSDNNWDNHQFVSKDNEGKIIGYMSYHIDRASDVVDCLRAINFSDNKLMFGRDLMEVLSNIFNKFNFRKLTFGVLVGNPIERSYDRLIKKYGGRIVGVKVKDCKLMDNVYYDYKIYEIFREDYRRQSNGKNH